MSHEEFMRRAIELSREKMRDGDGGPFGAVVVSDGSIVGEGWNQVTSRNDPTAHAEVVAIRSACATLGRFSLEGAVIYSSCEPCPMCLAAIYWARLSKVYYANSSEDAERIGFDDAALQREMALPRHRRKLRAERVLAQEALAVFADWEAKDDRIEYRLAGRVPAVALGAPMSDETRIKVTEDGPYVVIGDLPIAEQTIAVDFAGDSVRWIEGEALHRHPHYALCRCGSSHAKPYCDGTHAEIGFDGTETASREPYEAQAEHIEGPVIGLRDAVALCADARFCHRRRIWHLAGSAQAEADVETVHHDACLCPSGRYTAVHKATGEFVEPDLPPSIGLVEDPSQGVSGPLWVRGGVPVESADGAVYETRNRVTLCRCGASSNKPFCDGSHLEIGFDDKE